MFEIVYVPPLKMPAAIAIGAGLGDELPLGPTAAAHPGFRFVKSADDPHERLKPFGVAVPSGRGKGVPLGAAKS